MDLINEIKEWIEIETKNPEERVLGIDGDFGTGKTTFVQNKELWKEIKDKENIFYINLLELDFDDKFISNLILICSINFAEDVQKNYFNKKCKKIFQNFFEGFANGTIKIVTGGLYQGDLFKDLNNTKMEGLKSLQEKLNQSIFILDDIERINPENILKALGFINKLRWKHKKIKIILPYNKKFLNGILKNYIGDNYSNHYIEKYIGNTINFKSNFQEMLNYISNELNIEEYKGIKWAKDILNINWRLAIKFVHFLKWKKINFSKEMIFLFDSKALKWIKEGGGTSQWMEKKDKEKYLDSEYFFELMDNNPENNNDIRLFIQQIREYRGTTLIDQKVFDFFNDFHNKT